MKKLLTLIAAVFVASPMLADLAPLDGRQISNGTRTGILCSAETSTGVCATTDQLVLDLRGRWSVTFFGNQSTATAYTCDIYGNDIGHDAASAEGQDLTASSLTETNQVVALEGLLGFVWVNCSTITGGNVTVTYIAAPM